MTNRAKQILLWTAGFLLAHAVAAGAQTTPYHLHKEPVDDFFTENCSYSLRTPTGPDAAALAIQSADLKNHAAGVVVLACFEMFAGTHSGGTIPQNSTVTFNLWMKKTASWAVILPQASLQLANGTQLCSKTLQTSQGGTPLSQTSQLFTFSCSLPSAVSMSTTDRLKLYVGYSIETVPGNHSVKAELDIETGFDSLITVPNPVPPTPTITGFNYPTAPPNTVVQITGTNFGATGDTRSVTFDGATVATANWTATSVDVTVPAGLAPGPSPDLVAVQVKVIVQGVQSAGSTFSINPPPTLTSLTPSSAHTTDVVTVTGQNFLATQAQGPSTVTFNGVAASPSSWNNTTIQVPVPAGQASGAVVVTVAGRSTTGGLPFTLIPPPVVSALYPASGQVGASVTIVGQRFGAMQGANTIKFNGTTATPTQWSDTVIKAPVPAGATTGAVVVKVSNQPSPDTTFTVVVAGGMAGTISRVTGGTAISSASVQALLGGVMKGTATTASDGTYSISSLDPGTYDVRVFKSGFSPELRTGNVVTASGTATVNVTMYQPGSATGKVTQADGVTPLVGAAVTVYEGPSQKGSTNTNASGDYTVGNLHPGSFTVQAANAGYRTAEQSAAIVESAATTTNFSLDGAPAGPVLYAYDELGRLVQVTDPSGQSAIYRYDAVGNITAIERPGASAVSISAVSPTAGAVTTAVTIHGSGFSATPSQNVVKFNGVDAVVTSASATELATTVPAGASDGAITVTVSATTGTSPAPFDVTTVGAPTVSGFSPTSAAAGTAVTINGTNFDPVPGNDSLRVNLSPSQVTSATATAIQTTIAPSATTGRVAVATPNGTGLSTDYLWIAPPPYLLSALGPTTAASLNTDVAVSAPSDKIALLAFEGTEGQRVAINATNVSGNIFATTNVHLYTPFGALIKTLNNISTGGFLDTVALRWTGTYSVVFDPLTSDATTGTLRIINVPPDDSGPIAFGTPLTTATTVAGQNVRRTFTGTIGHRFSLSQSGFNCFSGTWSILAPDGSVLAPATCNDFIEPTAPAAATGTYTVLVDPKDAATGSTTLTLSDVPADISGTLTINDPVATSVPIQTPGQNASYTFSGSNAQAIRVQLSGGISGTFPCVTMSLLRPNGSGGFTQLAQTSGCGGFTLSQTLPATDTYTIKIDPIGNSVATGTVTVRIISP